VVNVPNVVNGVASENGCKGNGLPLQKGAVPHISFHVRKRLKFCQNDRKNTPIAKPFGKILLKNVRKNSP
jgi:hypothetical protein